MRPMKFFGAVARAGTFVHGVWADAAEGIREMFVAMWISGVLLIIVGIYGDYHNWWSDRQFLANMVSALTGSLFGIPFVLLVIQRITAYQTEQLEKRQVRRLATRAGQQFSSSVNLILSTSVEAGYALDRVKSSLAKAEEASIAALEGDGIRAKALDTLLEVTAPVIALWDLWRRTFGPPDQMRKHWSEAQAAWQFLQAHVQARLIEAGEPWLIAAPADAIEALFAKSLPDKLLQLEVSISYFLRAAKQIGEAPWRRQLQVHLEIPPDLTETSSLSRYLDEDKYWSYLDDLYLQIERARAPVYDLESLIQLASEVLDSLSS
jgi:hypothetical protein